MREPFTTAQAAAIGLTAAALRTGVVRREHHGVYVESFIEPSVEASVAAARLVLPEDALLDGVSALQAFGVAVGDHRPLRFVSAHPHQVRRPGIRVRRTRSLPPTTGSCVSPARAFVVAAEELDLVDLVSAGDWLVRLGLATPAELCEVASLHRGRGSVLSRRAAVLVRERVDSPRESRLRLCLVLCGLPEPEVNPVLVVEGRKVGRVDLLLRPWRVVVEYEGDQHRSDRRQWNVDIGRHEVLDDADWGLVRVTSERMNHPRVVVGLVVAALRRAGWDGSDPTFDEEWHRLFPSAR